jgi:hypothetical protein
MKVDPALNVPTKASTDGVWIEWHKELKSRLGKKVANSIWQFTWTARGSNGANSHDLRTYMEDNGIKVETDTVASIVDTSYDIVDAIGSVFTMGKWITIVVIASIVGGGLLILISVLRNPAKYASAAVTARMGGLK